jgi:hypothetical protein
MKIITAVKLSYACYIYGGVIHFIQIAFRYSFRKIRHGEFEKSFEKKYILNLKKLLNEYGKN